MALGVTDLKKGQLIQIDGVPYRVVSYAQKVMGRGGSIVNVKIKSLTDGKVLDKTYKGNESIDGADVAIRNIQYLYRDGTKFYLMDNDTYEQFELATTMVEEQAGYLKEGDTLQVQFFEGNPISVMLPKNVPLEVTYTEDVVKGDTASSIQKSATLETGLVIKVPAFVKTGDVVSVDTESGTYRERVTQ
jgi:elongation factor P